MGHKIKPTAYRIGITKPWQSRYMVRRNLPLVLEEDQLIREVTKKKLAKTGVESIEIERTQDAIQIIVRSARPGLIIGRGGSGIDDLRAAVMKVIQQFRKKKNVKERLVLRLTIEEVRQPEISSNVVAENIVTEIEKRTRFRRVIKQALERIVKHKEVKGAKIMVSGRLDGAEISRTEWLHEGKIPLVTIRSDIDYAERVAHCTYGTVGIKVWIYKGEKLT